MSGMMDCWNHHWDPTRFLRHCGCRESVLDRQLKIAVVSGILRRLTHTAHKNRGISLRASSLLALGRQTQPFFAGQSHSSPGLALESGNS